MNEQEPTIVSICFDREGAKKLLDVVDKAKSLPSVVFREDLDAMREDARKQHSDAVDNLILALENASWFESLRYFVDNHK